MIPTTTELLETPPADPVAPPPLAESMPPCEFVPSYVPDPKFDPVLSRYAEAVPNGQ